MKDAKSSCIALPLQSFFTLLGILLFPLGHVYSQQTIYQTIRGTITDQVTGHPISGASVILKGSERESRTDSLGKFRITEVPIGRYVLRASAENYSEFIIPDLVLHSGKEQVVEIELAPPVFQSKTIEISSGLAREVNQISTRIFTVEESKRFAAVYFDPARMASSYPGVVQNNDQTNHLVIRGNSPNGMAWRLEGVDVVNPNHTANAGTFTDRLTQTGGGTIILSSQLLTNSTFSTGAFQPEFGNALSGVFDIHLRKGNDEKFEFTGQAGLIGIDLAAEGPINKKTGSSFLANYRYSTVGLLGQLGVDFGGETINYQDLAFNLKFPSKKAGHFTFFAMGGLSSNLFAGPREDSLRQEQKDRFDIRFRSNMGAVGITHKLLLGSRTVWKNVFAISGLQSSRIGEYIDDNSMIIPVEDDTLVQTRSSFKTSIIHKLGTNTSIHGGVYLNRLGYRASSTQRIPIPDGPWNLLTKSTGSYYLLQPYINIHHRFRTNLEANIGAHSMYFFLNDSKSLEPRASIIWRPVPKHKIHIAYGLHSQQQLPGTYFTGIEQTDGEISNPNLQLDFTRAHHLVASYDFFPRSDLRFHAEHYQQYLFRVPIVNSPTSTFSALNLFEGYVTDSLVNAGTGVNTGWELSVEKYLTKNFYLLWSGMWYNSQYTAGDGIQRSTRFNGRFGTTATGGWEFNRTSKKDQPKVFGVNARIIYTGGFRAMPIDLEASRAAERTVFDSSNGFTEQLPNYFRVDFRILFKRHGEKLTRTFSLDIQNATNHQNVAFRTYDFIQDEVITRMQLGIIPLLSYRIEF